MSKIASSFLKPRSGADVKQPMINIEINEGNPQPSVLQIEEIGSNHKTMHVEKQFNFHVGMTSRNGISL